MSVQLSEGSLSRILAGNRDEKPLVQILGVRKMNQKSPQERYRMMISDGLNSINFAMLGTQLNPKVESGELVENTIIRLNHSIMSKIKDKTGEGERKVIIVLECEVVVAGSEVNTKMGNPTPLTEAEMTQQAPSGKENGGTNNAAQRPSAPTASASTASTSTVSAPAPRAAEPVSPMGQQPTKKPRLDTAVSDANIRPISSVNPFQNKWVIKARVTAKPKIRTWTNQRGEGKLFSMDLKDKSGEIRATAFNDEVDKFFDMIEVGKVYMIGNCVVKTANKKFCNLKHDYEISFTRDTFVQEADDGSDVPTISYEKMPIESIKDAAVDSLIDIVAVCHSCSDVQNLISRTTNKELKKRDVSLVDDSLHAVSLTLWGEEAENFNIDGNPVIAIRNARIGQYQNAKNLSHGMSSNVVFNPDIPEAHQLRGWYDNGGSTSAFNGLSTAGGGAGGSYGFEPWKDLCAIKDERLGTGDKPDYLGCVATALTFKKENWFYMACPTDECKKKLIDSNNGLYRCEKCDKDYSDYNPRMILNVNVADWTNNIWVTLFDAEAQSLLGMDGKELIKLKEEAPDQFNAVFDKLRFAKLQLKLRVKMDTYNDEQRQKTSVAKLEKLNLVEYNQRMLKEIAEMRAQLKV